MASPPEVEHSEDEATSYFYKSSPPQAPQMTTAMMGQETSEASVFPTASSFSIENIDPALLDEVPSRTLDFPRASSFSVQNIDPALLDQVPPGTSDFPTASSSSAQNVDPALPPPKRVRSLNIPTLRAEAEAEEQAYQSRQCLKSKNLGMMHKKVRRWKMTDTERKDTISFPKTLQYSDNDDVDAMDEAQESEAMETEETTSGNEVDLETEETFEHPDRRRRRLNMLNDSRGKTESSGWNQGQEQKLAKLGSQNDASGLKIKLMGLDSTKMRREFLAVNFRRCEPARKMHVRSIIISSTWNGQEYVEMLDSFIPKEPRFDIMPLVTVQNLERYFADPENGGAFVRELWEKYGREKQKLLEISDDY